MPRFVEAVQLKGIPGVVVPHLVRANPVQRRKLPRFQQEVDRRRRGPDTLVRGAGNGERGAEQFCEVAALGMGLEGEQADDLFGGGSNHRPTILRARPGLTSDRC